MSVRSLECPCCGGSLLVPENTNTFSCKYCGASLQSDDAEKVIKIVVDGIPTVGQRMILAEQQIESGNYESAEKTYKALIEVDPKNHSAWWGVFQCEMLFAEYYKDLYGWSTYSYQWGNKLNGIISAYALPAIKYAPEEYAEMYRQAIAKDVDLIERMSKGEFDSQNQSGSGCLEGCYIATAVYGSYYSPNVLVLRRFRDQCLMQNFFGRIFVKIYYFISPKLVKHLSPTSSITKFIRHSLNRFVLVLQSSCNH